MEFLGDVRRWKRAAATLCAARKEGLRGILGEQEIAVPRDKPDYISGALAGHSLWNTLPSVSRASTLKVVAPLGT
jgi:hypothetical protein